MKRLIVSASLGLALATPAQAIPRVDHWPGCKTRACDLRVGARIRAHRALMWLKRERPYVYAWRYEIPAAAKAWVHSTASCESGGDPHNRRNPSFRGLLQFSYSTWAAVGGSTYDPADASWHEQAVRGARHMLAGHRGDWPVCG